MIVAALPGIAVAVLSVALAAAAVADLSIDTGSEIFWGYAHFPCGTEVVWNVPVTRSVGAGTDTDLDGIYDLCDDCPTVGGSTRGPDGCP